VEEESSGTYYLVQPNRTHALDDSNIHVHTVQAT